MALTPSKLLHVATRLMGVVAAVFVCYWFWNHQLTPAAGLLVGIGSVFIGRWLIRQNRAPNPFGDAERNFALRPVLADLLRSGGCFVGALLWAVAGGLATRHHRFPDTPWGVYGLFLPPLLALILGVAFFLGRAGLRAIYGFSSKARS